VFSPPQIDLSRHHNRAATLATLEFREMRAALFHGVWSGAREPPLNLFQPHCKVSSMAELDKPALRAATQRGEPLADFTISFADGLDFTDLTRQLNHLADDIFVHDRPYYTPSCRLVVATKAALEREFGWVIRRAVCPSGGYWWEVVVEPKWFPIGLEGCIVCIGLTQPGGNDDGQPFEWK